MITENKKDFHAALSALAAVCQVNLTEATEKAFWWALEDAELNTVLKGIKSLCQNTNTYGRLPTPGDIRKAALGDVEGRAVLTWERVLSMLQAGSFPVVQYTLDDELAHAALKALGGHHALGQMPEEECANWGRKKFIAEYQRLAASPIPEELKRPISGIYDTQMVNGLAVREIKVALGTSKVLQALEKPKEASPKELIDAIENGDEKFVTGREGCQNILALLGDK